MLGFSPLSVTPLSALPAASSPNVTVNLSGVQATGQLGSVGINLAVNLTGIEGTGQLGTLTASSGVVVSIAGVEGTGQTGSLSPSTSVALSGVEATGQTGAFTPATSLAITGQQATGQLGSVAPDLSVLLSGVQATGQLGTLTASSTGGDVTVNLSGVEAIGQLGTLGSTGAQIQNGAGFPSLFDWHLNQILSRKAKEVEKDSQLPESAIKSVSRVNPNRQDAEIELAQAKAETAKYAALFEAKLRERVKAEEVARIERENLVSELIELAEVHRQAIEREIEEQDIAFVAAMLAQA